MPPARPGSDAAWALFLDFDGTLVDLAATPNAVVVPARLRAILSACAASFGGAVAIVSGRPIAALDGLLDPLRLPAAGLHGLELRMPDGTVEHAARAALVLGGLRTRLLSLAQRDTRLLVEDKGSALALHFRRAPEREEELRALVSGAAGRYEGHHVLHGKKVVEVRPAGADKGHAVARFPPGPAVLGAQAGLRRRRRHRRGRVRGREPPRGHQRQGGRGRDRGHLPGAERRRAARLAERHRPRCG